MVFTLSFQSKGVVHWWLSGIHSELPIKGLGVQGQPVVIWCSVFLLAAVAAVTI